MHKNFFPVLTLALTLTPLSWLGFTDQRAGAAAPPPNSAQPPPPDAQPPDPDRPVHVVIQRSTAAGPAQPQIIQIQGTAALPMTPGQPGMFQVQPMSPGMPVFSTAPMGAGMPGQPNAFYFRAPPRLEKGTFLGVSTSPAQPVVRAQLKLAKGMGLVVDFVDPEGPGKTAGIQLHDVLVKLNDQLLVNNHQLAVLIRSFKKDDTITFTLIREARPQEVKVKLTERDVPILDEMPPENMQDFTIRMRDDGQRHFQMMVPPPGMMPQGPGSQWVPGAPPRPPTTQPSGPRNAPPRPDGRNMPPGPNSAAPAPDEPTNNASTIAISGSMQSPGGDVVIDCTLEVSASGPTHLKVMDRKTGKTLFDGPVSTPEQRRAVPPELLPLIDTFKLYSFQDP